MFAQQRAIPRRGGGQVGNGSHYCYTQDVARQSKQYPTHTSGARALALAVLVVLTSACTSSGNIQSGISKTPVVVVTYSILGDLVADLVGDAAKVIVVIPNGQDQHEFEPSAKIVEQINNVDFIVSNGLDLEEHLTDVLAEAATRGVGVFMVAEHVTLRKAGAELTDAKDGNDPHLWLDPITLAEMIPDLSNELGKVLGVDLSDSAAQLSLRLATIDAKITEIMTTVPRCALVTGHDSLGYFAARYGCQIVGAVIPSLSSSAETSAGELADLKTAATQANVRAVFTEMGTPRAVVDQITKEVGVKSVELRTHMLPTGGHYADVMIQLATSIADALK